MASQFVKDLVEATAQTADNLSDGRVDPGDLKVLKVAFEKIEEISADELADELSDPRVQQGLSLGAMLIRGAASYLL